MKRLYIALAFLAIVFSLCAFEQYTMKSTYTQVIAYVDSALDDAEKNDIQSAQETCRKLSTYWDRKYPCLTSMIDHSSLDEASMTITALDEIAENNNSDELITELITAKNQMKVIYKNQSITLGNIL